MSPRGRVPCGRSPLAAAAMLALLSACVSTGIVGIDGDVMMVHKKSPQVGFGSPDGAVADVYREAGEHCAARSLALQTVELAKEATLLLRPGSATLRFRCVRRPEVSTGP